MSSQIENRILQFFGFLFRERKFRLVSTSEFKDFANWVVLMYSPDCRIRILCDRGEVSLAIGPVWLPRSWQAGPWYDLASVLEFLTHQQHDLCMTLNEAEDDQLRELANTLEAHIDQVCSIFDKQSFETNQSNLDRIQEQIQDRIWKKLGL